MNQIIFNLDEGNLDLPDTFAEAWQIPTIVNIVSNIFYNLLILKPKDREFSFCIKFDPKDKDIVHAMVLSLKRKLPNEIKFYECDGQTLFTVRNSSGVISNAMCLYIITSSKELEK